jgi:hypothetical protein
MSSDSEQIFIINYLNFNFKQQIVINLNLCSNFKIFYCLDTKERILLAFILRFVDFYEEYKLRPDSYFIQC